MVNDCNDATGKTKFESRLSEIDSNDKHHSNLHGIGNYSTYQLSIDSDSKQRWTAKDFRASEISQ